MRTTRLSALHPLALCAGPATALALTPACVGDADFHRPCAIAFAHLSFSFVFRNRAFRIFPFAFFFFGFCRPTSACPLPLSLCISLGIFSRHFLSAFSPRASPCVLSLPRFLFLLAALCVCRLRSILTARRDAGVTGVRKIGRNA